ncbi:MAG: hypothetical protein O7J95_05500, partial [Planctomycetota bacterium]|nr:hypothetical protein [Planctomycetota bacterium]
MSDWRGAGRHVAWGVAASLLLHVGISPGWAQGGPALFINEVIADNGEIDPVDYGGRTPDLIEIYNASTENVVLGKVTDAQSYYLSDTLEFCTEESCALELEDRAWRFPEGRSTIPPGSSIVVFCDADRVEATCELHASFRIDSDGGEPLTLWGPEDPGGERPVVDRVWLPPLRRNVSFGRFRDGTGPAPVPLEETLEHFVFHRLGTPDSPSTSEPSFGSCVVGARMCILGFVRTCTGDPNGRGVNLEPRVTRVDHTTNSPEVGEAVEFTVRVRDDKEPTPGNIARVELRYRVDEGGGFGTVQMVEMEYDSVTGIQPVIPDGEPCDPEDPGCDFPEQPLDRWTLWTATIPGQVVRGARVEFHFAVEDRGGLSSTSPRPLCEELPDIEPGLEIRGPCDRQFGGLFTGAANCLRDLSDVTCRDVQGAKPVLGERFVACDAWSSYTVGYEPAGNLEHLVINEVVPLQQRLLADPMQRECVPADLCPMDNADCCKKEDFIELHNTSDEEINLAGLWLSDRFF